jgi:hypothetical protein
MINDDSKDESQSENYYDSNVEKLNLSILLGIKVYVNQVKQNLNEIIKTYNLDHL